MSERSGPFVWLARHPGFVLALGGAGAAIFLAAAWWTGKWHWFGRGGALMALAGFIVSVQEALLYSPPRDAEHETKPPGVGFEGLVREGPFGVPVFSPDMGPKVADPELTQGESDKAEEAHRDAWDEAEVKPDLIRAADRGRPMRDLSQLSDAEFSRIRLAAVFGVIGTFIWAFGDLVGGLPC